MNNQLGIHNWGGSEDNKINGNSFISNEIQVKYVARENQEWENNYWSDYIGWDLTGDGIGDSHYESNSVVDHILWRYPMAKVLYTSASLQLLWMLEKQFPVFEVPKVIDTRPAMSSLHAEWEELRERYSSYVPERIYGEIKKMPHIPGGGI
jgi:nitrous oxidase accessory protein